MRSAAFIGLLATGLAGLLAIGCMTTPYTDDSADGTDGTDGTGTHSTTSKTKSGSLPDSTSTSKTPAKTQAPPVTGDTAESAPGTGSSSPTPGSGGSSDAGAATAADGGTCTPGTMSASGYEQNPSKAHQAGACSQSDIGYYAGLLNVNGQTYGQMQQEMRDRNTKCANCMFSNIDDAQWSPVVMEDANGGFFNWASCYALAPGGNDKCGSEVQQYFDCLDDVCAMCSDDASLTDCQNKAAADTTSCGGLTFTDCSNLDALNAACSTVEQALTYACN